MAEVPDRRDCVVICPVHDERALLEPFCRKLRRCYSRDVIFVDDGSKDGSGEFLASIADGRTFVLKHRKRTGYGAALLTGFRAALERGCGRIVTLDADLQHNPEHIGRFLRGLSRCEVVLGSRYPRGTAYAKAPGARLAINRFMAGLLRILFSVRFSDPFCGYRSYRDSFIRKARLFETGYGLGLEILMEIVRTGASFREIPVEAVYLQRQREFLNGLDDPRRRLLYYLEVVARKSREGGLRAGRRRRGENG